MELSGGDTLIFTKFFRGRPMFFMGRPIVFSGTTIFLRWKTRTLWKSSGVNAILVNLQG